MHDTEMEVQVVKENTTIETSEEQDPGVYLIIGGSIIEKPVHKDAKSTSQLCFTAGELVGIQNLLPDFKATTKSTVMTPESEMASIVKLNVSSLNPLLLTIDLRIKMWKVCALRIIKLHPEMFPLLSKLSRSNLKRIIENC